MTTSTEEIESLGEPAPVAAASRVMDRLLVLR